MGDFHVILCLYNNIISRKVHVNKHLMPWLHFKFYFFASPSPDVNTLLEVLWLNIPKVISLVGKYYGLYKLL